jgi:hypothetical protein
VFENVVLSRIFVSKRDEVVENWRKLHNEGLHKLYYSPNTVKTIISKRMRWAGQVERMGEKRGREKKLGSGVDRLLLAKNSDR